jgi:eukaryotic-like serine/threonine-protein kinase
LHKACERSPMSTQDNLEFEHRELLIALLAVQNELLTREDLIHATRDCLQRKDNRLLQQLYSSKLLSKPDIAVLKHLVDRHLERNNNDFGQTFTANSSFASILHEIKQVADESRVTVTGEWVAQTAAYNTQSSSSPASVSPHAENTNRFRIVREHARGGLGVVYVAEDTTLRREVVVKQIRRDRLGEPIFRDKFVLEAKVTGNLEHPGIVPVYALGTDASGSPYYAMRFIRGQDHSAQIQEFHQLVRQKKTKLDGPELRGLIRRFIDVCNAIEYAHDRGVLHRDLKPGNIMLGKHGETLVVDWGLAKVIEKEEAQSTVAKPNKQETFLNTDLTAGDSHTTYGSFVGTPTYAPPEQLLGKLDELGPASDVYALGAILYELLTGHRTVQGNDLKEIVAKVTMGKIVSPINRNRSVPKPLSSICMKALATRPANRYASVKSLRIDIEAWLDDLPISAKKESIVGKFQRWLRKNRTVAVATLVASSLISIVAVSSAIALNNMRSSEIAAKRSAEDQRNAASIARDKEQKARVAESQAKILAQTRLKEAEENNYLANIRLAAAKWETSDIRGMIKSLETVIPMPGNKDYRDWEWHFLWNLCHNELFRFEIGSENIHGQGVDMTRGRLYASRDDGTVLCFDLKQNVAPITIHKAVDTLSADLSPDGRWYVALQWDKIALVIDTITGRVTHRLKVSESPERYPGELGKWVRFHPNGQTFATIGFAGNIKVWQTETGKLVCETAAKGRNAMISSFSLSPTENEVAISYYDLGVEIYNTANGELLRTLKPDAGKLGHRIAFSQDGQRLVFGKPDGTVCLVDSKSGVVQQTWKAHDNVIYAITTSPDGSMVATGGRDRLIKVWSLPSGQLLAQHKGHELTIRDLTYSSDSKLLLSSSTDGTLRIWDTAHDITLTPPERTRHVFAATPSLRYLVRCNGNSSEIIDTHTGRENPLNTQGLRLQAAISPDGHLIAYPGLHDIFVKETNSPKTVMIIDSKDEGGEAITFSRDGEYIVFTNTKGTIRVHKVEDRILDSVEVRRASFTVSDKRVPSSLIWSDSTSRLAVTSGNTLYLYDFPSLELRQQFHLGISANGMNAAFAWDSRQRRFAAAPGLLFIAQARNIHLWDTSHFTKKEIQGHSEAATGIVFNSRGNRMFSVGLDNVLKVWNPETAQEIVSITLGMPLLRSLSFELHRSEDDSKLLAIFLDGPYMVLDGRNPDANSLRITEQRARWLIRKHIQPQERQIETGISAISNDPLFPNDAKEKAIELLKSSAIELTSN